MPRTFDCPKCGAPVGYSNNPAGQEFTVRCNYCSSALMEPSFGRPAHVVHLKIDPSPRGFKVPRWVWLILLVPVFGVVAGVVAMIAALSPLLRAPGNPNTPRSAPAPPGPRGGREPVTSMATVFLKFGSEGMGPGMFNDARSIALDGAGNIYVGEYSGGRIQVFDSAGKFITQWSVDPKMPLRGLAADRKGTVYVVQSGNIKKYAGLTGDSPGEMAYSGGWGFDDIIATADGGLVCAWYKNHDDIVRFNASGNVSRTIKAAISSASGDSELNTRVTIDGLGNIYALGTFNNAVFKFGPDGKYINRFGGDGDRAGQFRAPGAIAVDGKGRVYVSDSKGIQIFDGEGRYIDVFKPDGGFASGMIFNDRDELFVVARNKVVKLVLKQ